MIVSRQQKLNNEGLKVIGKFTDLRELKIKGSGNTDAGLVHLKNLKQTGYPRMRQMLTLFETLSRLDLLEQSKHIVSR